MLSLVDEISAAVLYISIHVKQEQHTRKAPHAKFNSFVRVCVCVYVLVIVFSFRCNFLLGETIFLSYI